MHIHVGRTSSIVFSTVPSWSSVCHPTNANSAQRRRCGGRKPTCIVISRCGIRESHWDVAGRPKILQTPISLAFHQASPWILCSVVVAQFAERCVETQRSEKTCYQNVCWASNCPLWRALVSPQLLCFERHHQRGDLIVTFHRINGVNIIHVKLA